MGILGVLSHVKSNITKQTLQNPKWQQHKTYVEEADPRSSLWKMLIVTKI